MSKWLRWRALTTLFSGFLVGSAWISSLHGATGPVALGSGAVDPHFISTLQAPPDFISVLPDRKILVARNPGFDSALSSFVPGPYRMERLNRDGSVDATFHVVNAPYDALARFSDVKVQLDGSIIVYPRLESAGHDFPITRILSDGTVDSTYHAPANPNDYRLPDGTVIQFGMPDMFSSPKILTVTRLNPEGTTLGSETIDLGPGTSSGAAAYTFGVSALVPDDAGRILVVLSSSQSTRGTGIFGTDNTRIIRLNASGTHDSSLAVVELNEYVDQVKRIADGSLYYRSVVFFHNSISQSYHVRKLKPDLSPEPSVDASWQNNAEHGGFVWDQSNDGAFFTSTSTSDTGSPVTVSHFDSQGQLDGNFSLSPPSFEVVLDNTNVTPPPPPLYQLADGSLLLAGPFHTLGAVPTAFLAKLYPDSHDASTYLSNVSIRASSGPGVDILIVGFVAVGTGQRTMLLRGIGPSLEAFQVTSFLADPQARLFTNLVETDSNDDWGGGTELTTAFSNAGAFALTTSSKDSALVRALGSASYTLHVETKADATGVCLGEVYDLGAAPTSFTENRLVNVSSRAFAGTGAQTIIAGFSLKEKSAKQVLIRGIGPGLEGFHISGFLADPRISVYADQLEIASNGDWGGTQAVKDAATAAGAFGIADASKDAALLLSLAPGNYTVHLTSSDASSGVALVEVYEVP